MVAEKRRKTGVGEVGKSFIENHQVLSDEEGLRIFKAR